MEGAAGQGEQEGPNLLHHASGYSTSDVCVFLQRPKTVLGYVQEIHGKTVEEKYWIRWDTYSLVVAREKQRWGPRQRHWRQREAFLEVVVNLI